MPFNGSEEELESTIAGHGKKVLYFTASWCPPCRMIAPIFQKMSTEFSDVKFVKIDIDEYGDAASAFNIRSVPTFVFMKDSELKSQVST
ncbi:thioredoxin [archaeon]|nr:MAG: thioredoxin [archaeon]